MSWQKRVWTQMCVGMKVFGHKRVWAQTCLGTNVSGHKRVWAQTCLGTNVSGQKHFWSTNVSGHKRVWNRIYLRARRITVNFRTRHIVLDSNPVTVLVILVNHLSMIFAIIICFGWF